MRESAYEGEVRCAVRFKRIASQEISTMKVKQNSVRKVSMICALCLISIFLGYKDCYAVRTDTIPKEDIARYEAVARVYVEQTRAWKPEEYRLTFVWLDDDLEIALFRVVDKESLAASRERQKAEGYTRMITDPTEGEILVHTKEMKAYEYNPDMAPSLSAAAAQSKAAPTREQLEMKALDKTFFEIADYLETHLPITPNTLEHIGFGWDWESSGRDKNRTDYKAYNYQLSDGTIIEEVELRHYDAAKKRGSFLVFTFGQNAITREVLESEFGEFVLYAAPRGKSVHERITWGKELSPNLTVMFGQNQFTRETVEVTFDNNYPKE